MKWLIQLVEQRRLILTTALLLSISGMLLWVTMIRQEDPRLPDFWGQVVIPFPGADALTVERLILNPVEDALSEVAEIKEIEATAFDEVAVLSLELHGDTVDFDKAWDEVRRSLEIGRRDFPAGAGAPVLDEKQQDQESVVLSVTGSGDLKVLLEAARTIKEQLLLMPQVSRVQLIADPEEQVIVALDDAVARRLGINAWQLSAQLETRNRILSGGSLQLQGKTVRLRPISEYASVQEISGTPIQLASGDFVPLSEVARVYQGPREPATARMRFNGEMSVGLGVVPRKSINLVDFGTALREKLLQIQPLIRPLTVHEVTFQPDRTVTRLSELNQSLLFGVLIVAGILFLTMGARLGLLVAAVIPLVTFTSVALFAWNGGVLHQISIAAIVLALGMLVDNAIVIAENVQWRMDRGESGREAALGAVRELAVPLAGATLTTLAAFVPMLIADGPTAAFTRTIPVVMMLTLSVSYVYAVLVTPALAQAVLVPEKIRRSMQLETFGQKLAAIAVRHPRNVIAGAVILLGVSLALAPLIRSQFFPSSDRNQAIIDLRLPEGSHLDATDAAVRRIETLLLSRPEVVKIAGFMGRSAPHFYYNIQRVPFSPHFAQLIVETRQVAEIEPLLEEIRRFATAELPQVELVARKLEQGPPVEAPVEIRLFGDDLETLNQAATMVAGALKSVPGTKDIRHDLGPGGPMLRFQVDDATAARHGVTRTNLALSLYGRTRGLPAGELRSGKDPIPVVIRAPAGERIPVASLDSLDVTGPDGRTVPLSQIARISTAWQPAAIKHRNAQRVVTVSSQLKEGVTFSQVLSKFANQREALALPPGVEMKFGGDAEGSGEANAALMKSFPIGMLLLLGVLMAEFNSFRRTAIILSTIPLAAAGVIPGLVIGDQPFGFMSLLGVIALVGVVVNNAIVLLEVVESRLAEGADMDTALQDAVVRRIRPILLTSGTTVAGLLPLAFSSSTLWPPLASAMISGLMASTMLTLLVVPALYRLLMSPFGHGFRIPFKKAAVTAAITLILIAPAHGGEPLVISLKEAMQRGQSRPFVEAADQRTTAAREEAATIKRSVYLPQLTSSASVWKRDRELKMDMPLLGAISVGEQQAGSASVSLLQPIFHPSEIFYGIPAAEARTLAQQHDAERWRQRMAAEAAENFLNVLAVEARIDATKAYLASLASRLSEVTAMADADRALEIDMLKVRLAHDQAALDLNRLEQATGVARQALARAIHHKGTVTAGTLPEIRLENIPGLADSIDRSRNCRPDIQAMKAAAESLRNQESAVRAERWPRLDASLGWAWDGGSAYEPDNVAEGRLMVTWTPFAAGTIASRSAQMAAERKALDLEIQEAHRGIELELQAVQADLSTTREAVTVEEKAVAQASETLRVERVRHLEGRATTNDLLAAEAQLRDRITAHRLARIEVVRTAVRLWLAMGEDDPAAGLF